MTAPTTAGRTPGAPPQDAVPRDADPTGHQFPPGTPHLTPRQSPPGRPPGPHPSDPTDGAEAGPATLVAWPQPGGPPPVRLRLPAGFHPLPLPCADASAGEPYDDRLAALVRTLFPGGDAAWHARMADGYRAVAAVYARRGLRYAAVGFFIPRGAPATAAVQAALTVAAAPYSGPASAYLARLAEAYAAEPGTGAQPLLLPCGPALAVARRELAAVALPRPGSRDAAFPTAHLCVHVPSPAAPWLYTVDVATASAAQWPGVAVLAADIASSLEPA